MKTKKKKIDQLIAKYVVLKHMGNNKKAEEVNDEIHRINPVDENKPWPWPPKTTCGCVEALLSAVPLNAYKGVAL